MSIGVPSGSPAISRPPEMQSSIAISSATRVGGSYRATALPITQIAPCLVPRARTEAIRLGDGIMP